jgi:replication-associated recombination protein RarA
MIPPTRNGLDAMACLSALQKCIRRSMEAEAMLFACELLHTSKGFFTMVVNRLEIVAHEDLDTALAPHVTVFVATCVEQAKRHYDPVKIGRSRMMIGNAIRAMARAPKSREADHFGIAIGLANQLGVKLPTIPDFAHDQHTLKGRAMKRGLDHFRREGAKLVPPPTEPDQYERAAYEMLELRAALGKPQKRADLFDDEA